MKKYSLVCIALVLCLAACGTGSKDEALKNSSLAPGTETVAPADKGQESRPRAEEDFKLTEQGKDFLAQMCRKLHDFGPQTTKDEIFWRDFLFYSYTGALEGVETEQVHREDLGFDETVVKISLQEAEAYTKLVFGIGLPDIKPSFENMEEGQTSCYYQDGFYYIGVSDFPDYQYTFAGYEESGDAIIVKYTVDFEGESNVGTVSFTIVPETNENGFIITSKVTE